MNLTIIMYHYVRDLNNSRYPEIKGLDINLFKEQLLFLKKHYNFVKMEDVISALDKKTKLPEKPVLITFDDAYIDHFTYVFPILDKMNIQGSFYPPVKAVKSNKVLDVNKIHFILASKKNKYDIITFIFKILDGCRVEYNLKSNDYYYDKFAISSRFDSKEVEFIKKMLQRELSENLRELVTNELFKKFVTVDEGEFSRELYMNQNQIKYMAENGMHIGVHGYNHLWLERLSKKEQEFEIKSSLDFLRELNIPIKNWTMCYPYGSYNETTLNILSEYGCNLALTTKVDIANLHSDNKFELPRLDTNDLPKKRESDPNIWYKY